MALAVTGSSFGAIVAAKYISITFTFMYSTIKFLGSGFKENLM